MVNLLRFLRSFLMMAAAGAAVLATSGCATERAPTLSATAAEAPRGPYRLGLGDKVRINVYGQPGLSGEYQVSGGGTVNMPLIGEVPAVDLTAKELEATLIARYGDGFLQNPSIVVEVYDFRPFFVLGEVERPGSYPAREGTTLLGAIATAGGYTYRANTKRIFIQRAGESTEYEVDPKSIISVNPGDVIRVAERYF
jgi:polysaccharide export outer membrane protein